ncbi:MAG TPA: hypothetical protein VFP01_11830, partial [Propionibacteriaceae bacterium]|nr:hypothetical protein [Propionibacteriaceae bacterium]
EVAARTSQAPEDALSHDLTWPGMLMWTLPNREMSPRSAVRTRTALPVTDRLAALECHWTALPNWARSVVGEHPGGLKETGTDAGSVLNAELAGSAPPQADCIVR